MIFPVLSKAMQKIRQGASSCLRYPLLPFFLSFSGGILLGNTFHLSHTIIASCLLFLFLGLLLAIRRKNKTAAFIPLHLILIFIGIFCMIPYSLQDPQGIGAAEQQQMAKQKITYRGFIEKFSPLPENQAEYILSEVHSLGEDGARNIPGRVIIKTRGLPPFHYGDYVQFRAVLKRPENFKNPGGFDYRKYLARQNIYFRGTISREPDMILFRRGQGQFLQTALEKYRDKLRDFIWQRIPPPERDVILALTLGEQRTIPDDLRESFNQTGTTHIIAISGLHVGLVAFFSLLFFRSLLKIFPRLLLRWNINKVSYALSLLPIFIYAGIAGMGTPVMRAALMAITLMTAILFRKTKDAFNALILAAIIILVFEPTSLFDVAFQLSFVAVAAILYLPEKLQHLFSERQAGRNEESIFRRFKDKGTKSFIIFLLVSVSATLATIPVIAYHFHRISFVSLLANTVVIPVLAIMATPVCLLFIILYPLGEPLCLILVFVATYLVKISIYLVTFFASLPYSSFLIPSPTGMEIIGYYVILLLFVGAVSTFKRDRHHSLQWRNKRGWISLTMIFLSAVFLLYNYLDRPSLKNLEMTVVDVGQGSCAVIQVPGDKTILIDGGGFEGSTFDMGRHVIIPFLLHKKIRKIDIMILTHPHADHLSGLIYILKNFPVGEVWINGEDVPDDTYQTMRDIIARKKIPLTMQNENSPERTVNNLRLTILNPEKFPDKQSDYTAVNNRSLVLKLRFGEITILIPGDISIATEKRLVNSRHDLKSDVLLVPHHGSRTSSTDIFLDEVKPNVALISCGLDNIYRLPHPHTLERYERRNIRIMRTDWNGALFLETDGHYIRYDQYVR
ncbi:MAG: DNA internalization-related competence protein ComEC/Rec2 [Syntrophobacterales bacterium]|jgi:competence protein ComEC|nr:DNA internalization-related competence protein ComEC/Rec2 [Syntrophobacterales bacterium]